MEFCLEDIIEIGVNEDDKDLAMKQIATIDCISVVACWMKE